MSWVPDGENPFGDNSQHGQSATVPLVSSSAGAQPSVETPPWLLESGQQQVPQKVAMQIPIPIPAPVSNANMGNSAPSNMNFMSSGSGSGMELPQDRWYFYQKIPVQLVPNIVIPLLFVCMHVWLVSWLVDCFSTDTDR